MVHQQPVYSTGMRDDAAVEPAQPGRGARGRLAAGQRQTEETDQGGEAAAQHNQRTTTASSSRAPAGLVRTQRVARAVTLSQGVNDGLTVACPQAMAAIGSGFSVAPGAAANVHLTSSLPVDADSSRS